MSQNLCKPSPSLEQEAVSLVGKEDLTPRENPSDRYGTDWDYKLGIVRRSSPQYDDFGEFIGFKEE